MESRESPSLLKAFGSFLHCVLENLARYQKQASWKVALSYWGEISISDLDVCFRTLWKLSPWAENEGLLFVLKEGEENRYFYLAVREGAVEAFGEVEEKKASCSQEIVVDLGCLKRRALEGNIAFWLCLLQGECLEQKGPLARFFSHLVLSPQAFALGIQWFFPFSGMGLVLFSEEKVVPWILYGGKSPKIAFVPHSLGKASVKEFTQNFRVRERLPLTLAVSTEVVKRWLDVKPGIEEILQAYGSEWFLSVPLEIPDALCALPKIASLFPSNPLYAQCNLTKESLTKLLRSYIQNFVQFLEKNRIFLELFSSEASLLLAIDHAGMQEVTPDKVVKENFFRWDMDLWATAMAWLNDTSLRLLTRFLEGIIPAEFSEKIQREEILIFLKAQNSKKEIFDLFISGGEHHLPEKGWLGDYALSLLSPLTKKILLSEQRADTPFLATEENTLYRVHFPHACFFPKESISFLAQNSHKMNLGWSHFLSATSVLSEIIPGLRHTVRLGELSESFTMALQNENYRIVSGTLVWITSAGRILKHSALVKHLSHTWISPSQGGSVIAASPNLACEVPSWWKDFVALHEQGGLTLDANSLTQYASPDCLLPRWSEEKNIEAKAGVGFMAKGKKRSLQFWFLHAWAVSFDKQGNFLIRVRTLARMGEKTGFALLEFPCRIPTALVHVLPVEFKKGKKSFSFYYNGQKILTIEKSDYCKALKPGWKWLGNYVYDLFRDRKNEP